MSVRSSFCSRGGAAFSTRRAIFLLGVSQAHNGGALPRDIESLYVKRLRGTKDIVRLLPDFKGLTVPKTMVCILCDH